MRKEPPSARSDPHGESARRGTKASAPRGRRVRSERGGLRGCTRGPALEEGTTPLGTYFLQKTRPQGDQVLSYSRG